MQTQASTIGVPERRQEESVSHLASFIFISWFGLVSARARTWSSWPKQALTYMVLVLINAFQLSIQLSCSYQYLRAMDFVHIRTTSSGSIG